MKKAFLLSFILTGLNAISQTPKWTVTSFHQKVFIENKSQFDGRVSNENPVLFGTENAPVQMFFSKQGITYRFEKREKIETEEWQERKNMSHEQLEEAERKMNIVTDEISMEWVNANPDVEVIAQKQVSHYYNFQMRGYAIENAKAFEKLIYKNLYPNVDVEYIFHETEGIKYNIILHKGADVSLIKMKYYNATVSLTDGNIHIKTLFGDVIDHGPHTYYAKNQHVIKSEFSLKGKTVSVLLENYDHNEKVIIDPWVVTPPFPNSNRIFNCETDSLGNVYVFGGDSPFKMQKYNAAGALQWTYNTPWDSAGYWFGTLITNRAGVSFITAGTSPEISRINTSGSPVWNNNGGFLDEYWHFALSCDANSLLCGGTRLTGFPLPNGSGRAYIIDMNNGNVLNSVKVTNAIPSFLINDPNEIRCVSASPNGNFYFITLDTLGALDQNLNLLWIAKSGYRFGYGSPYYGFTPQGQHIMASSLTYLYTSNGDSVVRRDINTGAIINGAPIPGGGHATTFLVPGTLPRNGGLVLDSCGNVYCGSQGNVTKFDASLNFISSASTPSQVYDVAIGVNGEVIASGNNFITSVQMNACVQVNDICNTLPIANMSTSDSIICINECIDYTDLTNNNPTSWQWTFTGAQTPASTLQNPTGICYNVPGTYDVMLIACNSSGCDTITFTNYITVGSPQAINLGNDTLICAGDSILLSPGSGFLSYLWNNGSTLSSVYASTAGSYHVEVSINGCISADTINISLQACNNVIAAIASSDTSFCEKLCIDFFDLSQNTPVSWQWFFPGAVPDTSTLQNPTNICYNDTGHFDVVLIACNATSCDTVTMNNFISEYLNPVGNIYQSNDTLYSIPFVTYQWYEVLGGIITGATNQYYVPQQPGNYYCVTTDSIHCIATSNNILITSAEQLNAMQDDIFITPNPGNGIFSIQGKQVTKKYFRLEIFDAAGKLLLQTDSKQLSDLRLNLTNYPAGVYSVEITFKASKKLIKLVIDK